MKIEKHKNANFKRIWCLYLDVGIPKYKSDSQHKLKKSENEVRRT